MPERQTMGALLDACASWDGTPYRLPRRYRRSVRSWRNVRARLLVRLRRDVLRSVLCVCCGMAALLVWPVAAVAVTDGARAGGASPAEAPSSSAGTAALSPHELAALDRLKAVPRKPLLKRQRLELSPLAALTLNDAYYQHFAASGSVVYYPHDAFGIGMGADYLYTHLKTSNIDDVRLSMIAVPAVLQLPRLFAHADLYWVPLYGKLAMFDTAIVHFDGYISVGLGTATSLDGAYKPAANVAVGQRYILSDWLTLRFEVRNHVFLDTQEVHGQPRSDLQNYLLFLAGVSFFVPPTFEYTYH